VKVVVTGAGGFLGWHLRCRLQATTDHVVVPVDRAAFDELPTLIHGADAIIHLAGVNRAEGEDLARSNAHLAGLLVDASQLSGAKPRLVHANSIQAGNGTPYGTGKAGAADTLAAHADRAGVEFVDVVLPNLFGEHGRPDYNSFVATFCRDVVAGHEPDVRDSMVELLHAQGAAQALIDALNGPTRVERVQGEAHGVREVLDLLRSYESTYGTGELPHRPTAFEVDLFNTFRSALFEARGPHRFERFADARGVLVEAAKSHGGGSQSFYSMTVPGATRGDHFHLRKLERFLVVAGQARIRLRRLFSDRVLSFDVSGDEPVGIDMPTMWAHNITNTGDGDLLTAFWADSVFDPAHPDTYPERVGTDETELEATR
jgi:UDP-2-acetamido-2,6-beta-L-arabino-hexul-4-ose reductase